MRFAFWRKRSLPTRYQKYWCGDICFIATDVHWTDDGRFVACFRPYRDYRAEMRMA